MVELTMQVVEQVPSPPEVPQAPEAPQTGKKVVRTSSDGVRIDNGDGTTTVIDEKGVRKVDNKTGKVITSVSTETSTIVRPPNIPIIPSQAVDISVAFFAMIAFIAVGSPFARAFARRMDRKAVAPPAPAETERLMRIEQSLEAVALEVERIGEGQRYVTQLMSSRGEALRVGGGQQ